MNMNEEGHFFSPFRRHIPTAAELVKKESRRVSREEFEYELILCRFAIGEAVRREMDALETLERRP